MSAGALLIHGAAVDGMRSDVLVRQGRIEAVARALPPLSPGVETLDADGGALIPGLHDHHHHLLAFAAARDSLVLGPPAVADRAAFAAALRERDAALAPDRWLRAVGYHESVAGPLDRWALDAIVRDRPMRVQHRTGAAWVLNSLALARAGIDGPLVAGIDAGDDGVPTGVLHRLDAWLRPRVDAAPPDLDGAIAQLNGYGVTGVTDATPFTQPEELAPLAAAVERGAPLRVVAMGAPGLAPDGPAVLARGPRKIVVDDYALPALDDLVRLFARAREERRAIAVHSVTLESLLIALAAWDEVGPAPGDRLEHGAVVPPAHARRLAAHRITVVTQPNFVAERGDVYLAEVDERDVPHLYPCRSLLDAGVAVGFGTDAPFGWADPWAAITAATTRVTAGGRSLGPHERIAPRAALGRFLSPWDDPGGPARRVRPGMPADLCLLRAPLDDVLTRPSREAVAATVVAGRIVVSP